MKSSAFKDRLPSALLALLIQAGLIGLLIFSFEAVRQPQHGTESILYLSRPLTRKLAPSVTIIDARGAPLTRNRSVITTAPPLVALPQNSSTAAAPSSTAQSSAEALHSLGQALFDCAPEKLARLAPDARAKCLPATEGMAKRDGIEEISPPYQANDQAHWNDEMVRKNTPATLPGAANGPIGIIITALINPGAYADKRSYTDTAPAPPPMSGADALYHAVHSSPACPVMSDFEKSACQNNAAASLQFDTSGPSVPPKIHVSEAQFQAALHAYHQRHEAGPLVATAPKPQ